MALDAKAQRRSPCIASASGRARARIAAIASDPRGALIAEIEKPGAGRSAIPNY